MRTLSFVALLLVIALLAACEPATSSAVKKCQAVCASDPRLVQLAPKVMYKPVKLCQNYCQETQGSCQKGHAEANYNICVYFGVNAGSLAPAKPGDLRQRVMQSFAR